MNNTILETFFPGLRGTDYKITSPVDIAYNCIAWAAGDITRIWWPDSNLIAYWPPKIRRVESLDSFREAFESIGYSMCDNDAYEEGFEKVAIYLDQNDKPTHAAKQVNTGKWISKLGQVEDVEHSLDAVEGVRYGTVAMILKRSKL